MEKKQIGKISHYYGNIGVAVVELTDTLKVGDTVSIEGANTNFTQTVDSMQIEHENIPEANSGQSIGMKMKEKARDGDIVYIVTETE